MKLQTVIVIFLALITLSAASKCQDYGTFCESWKTNGFCKMCFYSCEIRVKYCPKTCGFCDASKCVDCPAPAANHFFNYISKKQLSQLLQ